jgi:hypothetical protein
LGIGFAAVIVASVLLLADILEYGAAAGVGFIGILLIAASGSNRDGN